MAPLSMTACYRQGLVNLLDSGESVPSVLGAKSKASNFGRGNRPWLELIGYSFKAINNRPTIVVSPSIRIHVPYVLGLLAWTLDGRNDLESLEYYRASARDFSDDGCTMCGSFGARLFGLAHNNDQMRAIINRLSDDPTSRRTFAAIIQPADNIEETLEYPCAAGVQLFLRDGRLHWLTVMRAQQALTVLPYDLALFSMMHHFFASALQVPTGSYHHFSGTFHIYENELEIARQVAAISEPLEFPAIESGQAEAIAIDLIEVEAQVREAAYTGDRAKLCKLRDRTREYSFSDAARGVFVDFAEAKLAMGT
jgi:thymidylate synthase